MAAIAWILLSVALGCLLVYRFAGLRALQPRWAVCCSRSEQVRPSESGSPPASSSCFGRSFRACLNWPCGFGSLC